MKKYWTVFKISWSNSFIYRLNFLLWRFRSVVVILTVYFLWDAVFKGNTVIAGYTRDKILTYVFLTSIITSIVFSNRSIDAAGEISDGRLSNYLLKPLNYHLYWFARDFADKFLNIIFSIGEIILLYFILRPPIFLQTDPMIIFQFFLAIIGAIFLNFLLGNFTSYFSFWTPGNAWGFWFLYLIFRDFLGGVMYPLDIFPKTTTQILNLLPFSYLLYFPANVYLGKISGGDFYAGFLIMIFWIFVTGFLITKLWTKGIKSYQAEGR